MNKRLIIKNLCAGPAKKPILQGLNLIAPTGKITVLMGPNGCGKSTLANAVMGHPDYKITAGEIKYGNKKINQLTPDQRAKLGLFLSWQNPPEIPGVNFYEFLLVAYSAGRNLSGQAQAEFDRRLKEALKNLKLKEAFLQRDLNVGFSGGEKKKAELLQLYILQPQFAILDEIDSGLDVDALKIIAKNIGRLAEAGLGFLVITHNTRLLNYLAARKINIMMEGRIVKTGGIELLKKLEQRGYQAFV